MRNAYKWALCLFMIVVWLPNQGLGMSVSNEIISTNSVSLTASLMAYTPQWDSESFLEEVTIQPIFTPDNAEMVTVELLNSANSSIDLELQYIRDWSGYGWDYDLLEALVNASDDGVTVRVIINLDTDSDDAATYLEGKGISVKFLDRGSDVPDYCHNKGIIIDGKIVIISSANWSKTSYQNNREAGVVVYCENVANYFLTAFNYDWSHSETPNARISSLKTSSVRPSNSNLLPFDSIPSTKFTDTMNVTTFIGPDNAEDLVLNYLDTVEKSLYLGIYSISHNDLIDKLISLKNDDPTLDIRIIISKRRVNYFENQLTWAAAEKLITAGIPVYNSSSDFTYQHAKYWIIDSKTTFIYSGNWAISSMDGDNREWGVAIQNSEVASFYEDVFLADLAIAEPFSEDMGGVLSIGLKSGSIIADSYELIVSGTDFSTIEYQLDGEEFQVMTNVTSTFKATIDTTAYSNGIHTITVRGTTSDATIISKEVKINIINLQQNRILISEVLFNGILSPEEEFVEIVNGWSFDVYFEGWSIQDPSNSFVFPTDAKVPGYSTVIIANDPEDVNSQYGITTDFGPSGITFTNTGDYVILKDPDDKTIDGVSWGSGEISGVAPFTETVDNGQSIQRNPLLIDTDDCSVDFKAQDPTPNGDSVPQNPDDSELSDAPSLLFPSVILSLGTIVFMQRKKKNRK